MSDPVYATSGDGRAEFVEKKSRFIGTMKHVESEVEAKAFVAEISAKHRDATHNVYAYVLREQNIMRFSDDGEPQGTAGRPALEVLTRSGVTDCAVVVTRYFGGTLPGANGLVRAYAASAAQALGEAGIYDMLPRAQLLCAFTYADWARVEPVIRKYDGVQVGEVEYAADVTVPVELRPEDIDDLKGTLLERTAGRAIVEYVGENLCAVKRN